MRKFDKIFNWYFKRSALPYWLVLTMDCAIIYASLFFVYWMWFRGAHTQLHFYTLSRLFLVVFLPVCLLCFKLFHTYSGIIRYSSFIDLVRVCYANMLAMLCIFAFHYPIAWYTDAKTFEHLYGRHIALIFLISTIIMGGMRILVKMLYDVTTSDARALKAFIYGNGDGAVALAKNIRSQRPTKFILRGFISPENQHPDHTLMGVKVYPINKKLMEILTKTDTDAVLVSPIMKNKFRDNQELQDLLIDKGIHIYMVEEQMLDTDIADERASKDANVALLQKPM